MTDPEVQVQTMNGLSLEEYLDLPEEEVYRLEVVQGRLVREPRPGFGHSWVQSRLHFRINLFAEERGLGFAFSDMGFILADRPPTVRIPDLAFLSASRLDAEAVASLSGLWRGAPDLVVEIVSPSNAAAEMQEKVLEYLDAGARLVWIVDPLTQSVTVYTPNDVRLLRGDDKLQGGDVLPGFELPLSDLFAR